MLRTAAFEPPRSRRRAAAAVPRGRRVLLLATLLALPRLAAAGEADVKSATVQCAETRCRFSVTVRHADQGWDHYADRYEVLDATGAVLATRVLHHPHVDEQPFTRELTAEIPLSIERVRIRARDSQHGYGGRELELTLAR